jgi:hypothetical protein
LTKGAALAALFGGGCEEDTVVHLMYGKSISIALCAHFLFEAALITLLLEMVFDTETIDYFVLKRD